MLKTMQEQEKSNMSELVSKAEETGKNPAYASVVANTIALMKRQKKNMEGPFSSLFKTLHSEEMIQTRAAGPALAVDANGSPVEVTVNVKVADDNKPTATQDKQKQDEEKAIELNREMEQKAIVAVEGAKAASETAEKHAEKAKKAAGEAKDSAVEAEITAKNSETEAKASKIVAENAKKTET